jgi:hypothetical protein
LSLALSVNGTVHQAVGHIFVLAFSNKLAWIMKGFASDHSFAVLQDFLRLSSQ